MKNLLFGLITSLLLFTQGCGKDLVSLNNTPKATLVGYYQSDDSQVEILRQADNRYRVISIHLRLVNKDGSFGTHTFSEITSGQLFSNDLHAEFNVSASYSATNNQKSDVNNIVLSGSFTTKVNFDKLPSGNVLVRYMVYNNLGLVYDHSLELFQE